MLKVQLRLLGMYLGFGVVLAVTAMLLTAFTWEAVRQHEVDRIRKRQREAWEAGQRWLKKRESNQAAVRP